MKYSSHQQRRVDRVSGQNDKNLAYARPIAELPVTLLNFIKSKIKDSVVKRLFNGIVSDSIESIVSNMAEDLFQNHGVDNATFSQQGIMLSRAILSLSEEELSVISINSGKCTSQLLKSYQNYVSNNQQVFDTIQQHHATVHSTDWSQIATDTMALTKYGGSARAMGAKKWVLEANQWMLDFVTKFFLFGGKMRYCRKIDSTISDLEVNGDTVYQLLDVGSCYNPFMKMNPHTKLNITAVDLYPDDPSVLQSDFLNAYISDSISELQVNADGEHRQVSLYPANTYHAVTLSLVLSYLADADAREKMVSNIKKVLIKPNDEFPLNCGLLIIIEKESALLKHNNITNTDSNSRATLAGWKLAMQRLGFSYVKYQHVCVPDSKSYHAMVFATYPVPNNPVVGEAAENSLDEHSMHQRLWIKNDVVNDNRSRK